MFNIRCIHQNILNDYKEDLNRKTETDVNVYAKTNIIQWHFNLPRAIS